MTASRIHILLAALGGAAGVVLWAMAAHGGQGGNLATAAQMLLLHAGAVIGLTACRKLGLIADSIASFGVSALLLGVALFSGDLAVRAFAGQRLFPGAAPLGGGLLIVGWLTTGLAALLPTRR